MGVLNRGIRDAFRNGIRSFGIIIILAVAIAMALVMFMALKTVNTKIESVKNSIGNFITVSPAGIRGFEGGGELLNESSVDIIKSLPDVVSITNTLSDRMRSGEDTNLTSAIEPGSFGNRQRIRSNNDSNPNPNSKPQENFKMPVTVMGTSDLTNNSSLNISQLNIKSGKKFDAESSDKVAMIGTDLATKNNLSVDGTFNAYGQDIKIVGIFESGNNFSNSSVIMPIKTLQALSNQVDQVNTIIVQASSIDTITQLENNIKSKLGNKVDVISQQDTSSEAVKPLENIKTISFYSLVGALIGGAIILFLTMLMIVRERKREIGVLKAIGSSNIGIMAQFSVEALVLTMIGGATGIIIGIIMGNPVLNILIKNASSLGTSGKADRSSDGLMQFGSGIISGSKDILNNLSNMIGWEIILYGLLAAIIIAIIGSIIPAYFIAKIRPAEAMRAE